MINDFTVDDIKNSVEYQWRKRQIKLLLWSCLITGAFTFILFIVVFTVSSNYDAKFIGLGIIIWLVTMAIYGLILLPCCLFYYGKMKYLLNNYKKFNSYETVLDSVSTSYMYRGALYYTVIINYNGLSQKVRTNPCFSSHFTSKFTPEDFNNKKVVGLLDEDVSKFYIIKRVD